MYLLTLNGNTKGSMIEGDYLLIALPSAEMAGAFTTLCPQGNSIQHLPDGLTPEYREQLKADMAGLKWRYVDTTGRNPLNEQDPHDYVRFDQQIAAILDPYICGTSQDTRIFVGYERACFLHALSLASGRAAREAVELEGLPPLPDDVPRYVVDAAHWTAEEVERIRNCQPGSIVALERK